MSVWDPVVSHTLRVQVKLASNTAGRPGTRRMMPHDFKSFMAVHQFHFRVGKIDYGQTFAGGGEKRHSFFLCKTISFKT
jgi:hypothetical protein